MAQRASKTLTEVEREFMQIPWRLGESTPDGMQEVHAAQNREITGGSAIHMVATLLGRQSIPSEDLELSSG